MNSKKILNIKVPNIKVPVIDIPSNPYDMFMFPLEKYILRRMRKRLMRYAIGDVLEVGAGTGANLKYLSYENMTSYIGLDKGGKFLMMPEKVFLLKKPFHYDFIDGDVHELPFEDNSFDTVVFTLVFCSVGDPIKGLKEINRVLKPGGRLLFMEHILPDNPVLGRMFEIAAPFWSRMAKNCRLDRDTMSFIKGAGFKVLREEYFLNGAFVGGSAVKRRKKTVEFIK